MLHYLTIVTRAVAKGCLWFSGFGMLLMTAVIGWQVFARYVLNDTPHWSETFCLLLMLYFILFAAAAGVREGIHIGLVIFRQSLPPLLQRIVSVIIYLIICAFGMGMVWFGTDMVITTWTHVIPTIGLPKGISYLPFPLSGVLFMLFSLEHIINEILGRKVI